MDSISVTNAKFCFDVFNEMKVHHVNENILYCPLSILTALAMVYLGARGNTESQMKKVSCLHWCKVDSGLYFCLSFLLSSNILSTHEALTYFNSPDGSWIRELYYFFLNSDIFHIMWSFFFHIFNFCIKKIKPWRKGRGRTLFAVHNTQLS